jgi:hypothetical protein
MLETIKTLLGITDGSKDVLLSLLLYSAIDEAKEYTHRDEVDMLKSTIIQMVVFQYNRLGTEGLDSENYSVVSFDYSADYPESIMRSLRAKRKVRVVYDKP